jgi:hypothetical protein
MRFFKNGWARRPAQQLGAVIAVVVFVGLVGAQFNAAAGSISSQGPVLDQPSGEIWT